VHTRLSPDNPWGCGRYGFAWEKVPRGGAAHLDFGCYEGAFLHSLASRGTGRLVGVDASRDAVARGRERYPALELLHVPAGARLPFPDGTFTSVTLLDVIEHVADQAGLLDELNRVLSQDGRLIVTVPGLHAFSALDAGNLKFRFPRLHRWYYCRRHTREEYEYRYVSNPDGMIGDVAVAKRWHEHFSRKKLARLLETSGFSVVEFDGSGLFFRPLEWIGFVLNRLPRGKHLLRALIAADAGRFESANLFCVAHRSGLPGGAPASAMGRRDFLRHSAGGTCMRRT